MIREDPARVRSCMIISYHMQLSQPGPAGSSIKKSLRNQGRQGSIKKSASHNGPFKGKYSPFCLRPLPSSSTAAVRYYHSCTDARSNALILVSRCARLTRSCVVDPRS